ncbi:MAG: UDP-N-acetylmuramoyl-tripeptide--D-alanyl-D-alanine ligase [Candidatus Spechtbacterales bacterium]
MKIILFIIFILWLIKISRDVLFWVYLWQLKEYRLDRMRAHFELKSARQIFLNKLYLGKIAILFASALLFLGVWQFFYQIIVSAFYVILGGRSAYTAYKKKIREPIFTKKALLICGISMVPLVITSFLTYYKGAPVTFLFTAIFLDVFLPLIVAAAVGALRFPSDILKNKILAKAKIKRETLKNVLVIGITGSYGKTSIKEYLAHMLSEKLKVLKTAENQNSEIGIAQCLLDKLNPDHDVFIVEMGAYKAGEIKKICDIVQPQIGILSGINEQHLSLFGSLDKTARAKYELIESLPVNGLAIFNGENDYTRALYEKTSMPKRMYSLRSFSVSAKPDVTAEKIDFTKDGMRFQVKLKENRELFETDVLGRHNVLNILGATLAADALGMTLEEIKKRVKTLKVPPHTLTIKPGINGSTIIDDTYSANPRGVVAALEVLDTLKGNKKILIMLPLIELAASAADIHRKLALKIDKVCDVCILTSLDFSREIRKNAPNTDVLIMPDSAALIAKLKKNLKEGDIVLLENRVPEIVKSAITI